MTTTPNALVQDVHDRMPVILHHDGYANWLDPAFNDIVELTKLLQPFPAKEMRGYPVSQLVNSPKNDTPECIVEVPLMKAATLF